MDIDNLKDLMGRVTPGPFKPLPPVALLHLILHYNAETGVFVWKERDRQFFPTLRAQNVWNARFPGCAAMTSVNTSGYYYGSLFDVRYMAHRVAWAMANGADPGGEIDHINGCKQDNRTANLRVASRSMNEHNKALRADNTSGAKGVYQDKRSGSWSARIKLHGRTVNLGTFGDIEAAIGARRAAETTMGVTQ